MGNGGATNGHMGEFFPPGLGKHGNIQERSRPFLIEPIVELLAPVGRLALGLYPVGELVARKSKQRLSHGVGQKSGQCSPILKGLRSLLREEPQTRRQSRQSPMFVSGAIVLRRGRAGGCDR